MYLLRYSPVFRIKNYTFNVSDSTNHDKLLSDLKNFYAQTTIAGKFLGDNNLLAWNAPVQDFLKTHPQLKELIIKRDFLKREVFIEAKDRKQFGIWCAEISPSMTEINATSSQETSSSSQCFWFDEDGVAFQEAPIVESEIFYRVKDLSGQPINLGDKIISEMLIPNLKKIFQLLESANINTKTVSITDLTLEEVRVDSVSDPKMFFSLRFDPTFALNAIDSLKKSGQWNKISYINFTVENRAYYKLK